jgi:hypothetical protein
MRQHLRNELMTRGLSNIGAEQVASGQAPSNPADGMALAAPFVPGAAVITAAITGLTSTSTKQDDD